MNAYPYRHRPGEMPPVLQRVPLFTRLRQECVDEILQHASILDVDPSEVILEAGQQSQGMYVLLKGVLRVYKNDRSLAKIDQSGELFGELSFALNRPHNATIKAVSGSSVLKLDSTLRTCLSDENARHFDSMLYRYLTELLADRLEKATSAPMTTGALGDDDRQSVYVL